MGDAGISGIEAVGPAAEEAADVVYAASPEGGPAAAGRRLRAYSRPAGPDRLSPPLQARSRQGAQPCRTRPALGLSQTPALREAKRSGKKARTAPYSLTSERGKPRPPDVTPRLPRPPQRRFPQTPGGDSPAPPPRGPPGTVVFPGADSLGAPGLHLPPLPAELHRRRAWVGRAG